MKTIEDYIKQYNTITIFEQQLLKHIYIECHNNNYNGFILEGHSLFNGCDEIVNFIIINLNKEINQNNKKLFFKKTKLTFNYTEFKYTSVNENNSLIENLVLLCSNNESIPVFFDELILNIELINTDTLSASYMPKENNFNEKTCKLKECVINLSLPKNEKFNFYSNYVKKDLVHELTHAYEDYNRATKKGIDTLINILSNSNYRKAVDKIINGKDAIQKFVGQYYYCINKQEQNAYLAEFNEILSQNINDINKSSNKINYTLSIIKTTEIWKKYKEVADIIELLKTDKLNKIKPNIAYEYKELDNTAKNKTDESIIKYMTNNWDKFQHKFDKKLSKIIYHFINDYETDTVN